jgi:aldehyde dehydrogenase (NAD+)
MRECRQFYIDGKWVSPAKTHDLEVINPATEDPAAIISLGGARKSFSDNLLRLI